MAVIHTIKIYRNNTGMPAKNWDLLTTEINGYVNNINKNRLKKTNFWVLKLICIVLNKKDNIVLLNLVKLYYPYKT